MAAFTTIAAATSLAIAAGTTGASFAQASKQKKLQQKAESEAERALADARKRIDVNYYENLGIQKEVYQLEREALLSVGAQAIQAGVESERGAASVAGRVQMASQEGQRKVAAAMGEELMNLDKLVATEDAAIAQKQATLDLAEAQGAQLAARDAQQAAAAATAQGFEGLQSIGQQAMQLAPLYGKSQGAKEFRKLTEMASSEGLSGEALQNRIAELAKAGGNSRFSALEGVGYTSTGLDAQGKAITGLMTPLAFQDYLSGMGKEYVQSLQAALFPKQ
jgi:hypothetical protein